MNSRFPCGSFRIEEPSSTNHSTRKKLYDVKYCIVFVRSTRVMCMHLNYAQMAQMWLPLTVLPRITSNTDSLQCANVKMETHLYISSVY